MILKIMMIGERLKYSVIDIYIYIVRDYPEYNLILRQTLEATH